jgi:signal transduction histidine kinase
MKILIVDDRADNRLLLREQLYPLAENAVTADSGVRALREMRTQAFDLVITDLLMPEMDGFQLCYLLKTDPKLKKTPVVICTANYATKQDEDQAKNLGADDFITRPIDDGELTARIERVVRRSQTGNIAEPRGKPEDSGTFFREYSTLLIEKLEDQLITAEENAKLLKNNEELQRQLEATNQGLKFANEQLVSSNEDLEAFTYSVSHDLRAPVRAIEGMTELLVEELGLSLTPAAKKYIDRIKYNVDRMNALINGLLAHSRMRNISASVTPVDLGAAVASALATLDFSIREAGASVDVRGPFPPVLAHGEPLVQVIANLISNAVKFVAPGVVPHVALSSERRHDRVRLNIRDNGIGIAPQFHHKVFNVFERLDTSGTYPGTGVGLAIVRKGVERMGGAVGLESQVGAGSTFWIELKAADAAPQPA